MSNKEKLSEMGEARALILTLAERLAEEMRCNCEAEYRCINHKVMDSVRLFLDKDK